MEQKCETRLVGACSVRMLHIYTPRACRVSTRPVLEAYQLYHMHGLFDLSSSLLLQMTCLFESHERCVTHTACTMCVDTPTSRPCFRALHQLQMEQNRDQFCTTTCAESMERFVYTNSYNADLCEYSIDHKAYESSDSDDDVLGAFT